MARYGLIDAYADSLRSRIRWRPDVDAVVAEVEDHLYSTVERFEAGGIDANLAQRAALERFGDPDLVARAFATAPNGGLAIPTAATRTAGMFAIASAVLWLAVIGSWWLTGLLEPRYEWRSGAASIWDIAGAVALLGATSLMAAAMLGLVRRHGGLGALGIAGLAVGITGLFASFLAWVFTGWGTLTMLAVVLFGIAIWRRDVAPRLPVALMATGPVAGAVVWIILRSSRGPIDLTGLWGVHWLDNQVGLTIGILILSVGFLGIGRWLRSEEPALIEGPDRPVAA
jgi:hypothetical protein